MNIRHLIISPVLAAVTLTVGLAAICLPARAQTADDLAKQYSKEAMQQALETRQRFDLYGLRFESDQATIQADGQSLLDDIATALNNFPEWRLRIVGHTDATADPAHNQALSLDRANAIKAALVERGVDEQRLATAGAGEARPAAPNNTPEGRALDRRVELVRFTNSAEAKRLLKAMSDFLAAQTAMSFDYDATLGVVTQDYQKLALASSGAVTLSRPDKIHATRVGGFADFETLFDGKTLILLGNNVNKYAEVPASGTIEQLIDVLKDKYSRPLPAADLLMSDSYAELMQDVYDSKDLGSGVFQGVECDYLAFRKDEVDLQIWIAQGDRPFPCRYVVTSKLMAGSPEYSIEFRNWKTGNEVAASDFTFKNATNAEKIDLADLKEKAGELPANFAMGGGQ